MQGIRRNSTACVIGENKMKGTRGRFGIEGRPTSSFKCICNKSKGSFALYKTV